MLFLCVIVDIAFLAVGAERDNMKFWKIRSFLSCGNGCSGRLVK